MNKDIENIIKKNLPEKGIKWMQEGNYSHKDKKGYTDGFNQAISQINTSLIADEVLKVVVEKIQEYKMYYNPIGDDINKGRRLACDDIINYLSPNKENKNND